MDLDKILGLNVEGIIGSNAIYSSSRHIMGDMESQPQSVKNYSILDEQSEEDENEEEKNDE